MTKEANMVRFFASLISVVFPLGANGSGPIPTATELFDVVLLELLGFTEFISNAGSGGRCGNVGGTIVDPNLALKPDDIACAIARLLMKRFHASQNAPIVESLRAQRLYLVQSDVQTDVSYSARLRPSAFSAAIRAFIYATMLEHVSEAIAGSRDLTFGSFVTATKVLARGISGGNSIASKGLGVTIRFGRFVTSE